MTLILNPDARRIATYLFPSWIHLRVITGTVQLAGSQQELTGGDGLPLSSSDGVVSLQWNRGELWVAGDSTPAVLKVIIP